MTKESELLAIRRPARQVGLHGRENQLQLLGSVHLASPHGAIGGIIVATHSPSREKSSPIAEIPER